MFVDVFRHADYNPRELQTLKKGIMAGSSCPPPLCDRLVKELGMYDFGIGYGSTELSPLTTFSRLSEPPMERINSVGYAFYHTEVCVVDKNGQVVERGEKGEVCSRGANVMKGYWNDEKETKQSIDQDGWYHTGDVGIMHSNGSLEICGRITDGIIRGGENIYPAEVEAYLFKHPDISTVQVVGVPDDRFGEEVCAVVVLKQDKTLTVTDIREYCTGKISHYKIPKYILFKDESYFPLTATGKVKKNVLSKICHEELASAKN